MKQVATKQSIPSIKLIKFINAVPKIIKKKTKEKLTKLLVKLILKKSDKQEPWNIKYTVKTCVRYLIQEGKLYLSSIKPTKDIGTNFKNKPELLRSDINEKTITIAIPPPVGVGFI